METDGNLGGVTILFMQEVSSQPREVAALKLLRTISRGTYVSQC